MNARPRKRRDGLWYWRDRKSGKYQRSKVKPERSVRSSDYKRFRKKFCGVGKKSCYKRWWIWVRLTHPMSFGAIERMVKNDSYFNLNRHAIARILSSKAFKKIRNPRRGTTYALYLYKRVELDDEEPTERDDEAGGDCPG